MQPFVRRNVEVRETFAPQADKSALPRKTS